jgi:hypothetical protein
MNDVHTMRSWGEHLHCGIGRVGDLEEWVMRRSLWSAHSLSAATSNPGQRRFHLLPASFHGEDRGRAHGICRCVPWC